MTEWSGWLPGLLPGSGLLKDQAALVAGGAGGIGEAVTRILAAAGASVAIVDAAADRAAAVSDSIAAAGGSALPIVADLRDEDACARAVGEAAERTGGIDILVNVAGGMRAHAPWRPVHEWTTQTWDAIVDLNLRYVFWTCRAAIPGMAAGTGGAIVNVASIAGSFGSPNQSAYGAAKAGLIQFTQTLAAEYGPFGIRANAVSPGVTLTPPAARALDGEAGDQYRAATPLRKLGRPEDIARAVLFFASPMAAHVTGQTLLVEGGISVNFPYPGLGTGH
jgi:NAD(P)-dependent dehydrogenase (short-subunit alcohol dehydrogenase family)